MDLALLGGGVAAWVEAAVKPLPSQRLHAMVAYPLLAQIEEIGRILDEIVAPSVDGEKAEFLVRTIDSMSLRNRATLLALLHERYASNGVRR